MGQFDTLYGYWDDLVVERSPLPALRAPAVGTQTEDWRPIATLDMLLEEALLPYVDAMPCEVAARRPERVVDDLRSPGIPIREERGGDQGHRAPGARANFLHWVDEVVRIVSMAVGRAGGAALPLPGREFRGGE